MHTAVVHERTRVYKSSPIQIIHVHAVHAVNLVLGTIIRKVMMNTDLCVGIGRFF